MRTPERERLQIPLMFAFRDAFDKRDAAKTENTRVNGERVISDRSSLRRRGADEVLLRKDLALDLAALVDTTDLASVEDLAALPHVTKSVLNYGIADLISISVGSAEVAEIGDDLKNALLNHEPRLTPETLSIERGDAADDDLRQKVRFHVHADMVCKPLDVPVEFVAEVDGVSGKITLPDGPSSA